MSSRAAGHVSAEKTGAARAEPRAVPSAGERRPAGLHASLTGLQRTCGNRHVQRLLGALARPAVRHRAGSSPVVQRDLVQPQQMRPAGDRERRSPPQGVAVRNGTISWELQYVGASLQVGQGGSTAEEGFVVHPPGDVRLQARFTPVQGLTGQPTVTWIQTVRASTDSIPDVGRLLMTRDAASGSSVDAMAGDSEPFYGAEPRQASAVRRGWQESVGFQGSTGQEPWTQGGTQPTATHGDLPYQRRIHRGSTITRLFEAAVINVESAETFGSLVWGYTKTSDGAISLLGGTSADVRTQGATAQFEDVRQAFYRGQFQHSLSGFDRGSAALKPEHEATLRTLTSLRPSRLVLVGANDNSGGPEANAQLSLQRARAAAAFLVDRLHMSASVITAEGHGVEARVPNRAGAEEPQNRRVDVHYEQGAEVQRPDTARAGSRAERARFRAQNPRVLVDEVVDRIQELLHSSERPSGLDVQGMDDMLEALDLWRRSDPTVPNVRELYREQIRRIRERHMPPMPRAEPDFRLPELRQPFVDRIQEDARRLP